MGKTWLIGLSLLAMLAGILAVANAHGKKDNQSNAYNSGYDQGYTQGYQKGQDDHNRGVASDEKGEFKNSQAEYNKSYGSKKNFDKGYRAGFELGYQDGFSGKQAQITPGMEGAEPPASMARAETTEGETPFKQGWDTGYKTGYEDGLADHEKGAKMDADDAPGYKGYRNTYNESMGKRSHYKKGYKEGFESGYQDGYSGLISRLVSPPEMPQTGFSGAEETPPQTNQVPPEASIQPPAAPPDQAQNQPRRLPKTASNLSLLALLGLAGVGLSFAFRKLRTTA
jgi:flagellar biosynthesis/type III secretory pathway protein FliH